MNAYVTNRVLAVMLVLSVCTLGYTLMGAWALTDPEYGLTIDNIPAEFTDDKTLYIDTQTNDRAFMIFEDHVKIRSQYLTFYELNNSYEHDDINYVVGGYCYTPEIPAQNATLDTITEINRFQLSSWNGTVTVQRPTQYSENRMTLTFNSSDNATLMIRAVDLHRNYEYRVIVDGQPRDWLRVNDAQYIEYNYTGDWSNHTITFQQYGEAIEVPAQYLYLIEVMLCLGVVAVVVKAMVLPVVKSRPVNNEVYVRTAMKAMLYIVVSLVMIILVFKLFVGV